MKKKRVLALLLALSLAVGMNGMTVLATAPGPAASPVVTGQESGVPGEGEGVSGAQGTENSGEEDKTGGQNGAGAANGAENSGEADGAENPGEADGAENPGGSGGTENPGGAGSAEKPGEADDGENPGGTGSTENPGEAGGTEKPGDGSDHGNSSEGQDPDGEPGKDDEKPSGSEDEDKPDETNPEETDPAEEENPDGEKKDESVSENTVEETDETEENPDQNAEIRMMSFTDEVGMLVTYNAAAEYTYTVENGTLTAMAKTDGKALEGNIVIDGGQGITKIADGVFTGNTKITYISVPKGVTAIGENAFKGCTALKGMTIPTGVETIEASAFEGCSALTQFALPATVTGIGSRAFYGDTRLFMVYMRNADISKLQTIGDYAFYGCSALTQFCSDTSFTFPAGLASIGEAAFQGCRSIKSVAFSDNITVMGAHVFEGCSTLTEVVLPKRLDSIPQYAFADCRALVLVSFGDGNQTKEIESYAFKGCYSLGSIEFSWYVQRVAAYAFINCTKLVRVEIPQPICTFENDAFPDVETLCLIGHPGSAAETYTLNRNIRFSNITATSEKDKFYQWECEVTGDGVVKVSKSATSPNEDPNNQDNGKDENGAAKPKGVPAGTKLYVWPTPAKNNKLVEASLKCNGIPIKKEGKYYTFEMPRGGAVITVEFESTGDSGGVEGTDVTWELSNGDKLKIGQTTRLFLLDEDNNIIPTSKIKFTSAKTAIASVSSSGIIKALKEGHVNINVEVVTKGGGKIKKAVAIEVSKSEPVSLKLIPDSYNKNIITITDKEVNGDIVQVASIEKISVGPTKDQVSLKLKAKAYDEDGDAMAVALKWTTSDAKVAKLARTSSAATIPENTVTIPKGTTGEATITATATNSKKQTITQKFIVQVKDYTPRLSAFALTLNLQKEEGAVLEVISAYEGMVDADTFQLVYAKDDSVEVTELKGEYDKEGSSEGVYRYVISPKSNWIDKGNYNVKVSLNNGTYKIPLKITVASSLPNPRVAFDKKQQKINLFMANDGTQVKPVITNLGNEQIKSYSLEPLTSSENDAYFTKNFQIDEETGVITQKNANMIYTDKGKLVTTGYLVLHFEGYKQNAVKKYKITIPTQTVKPSYKLDKTSDTYNMTAPEKTVVLTLLDNKTKKQEVLDQENWTVTLSSKSTADSVTRDDISINSDGKIEMAVRAIMGGGKVVLAVRNKEWAESQKFEYTYTIKTVSANPKISLKPAIVNLNSCYPDQEGEFALASNQYDTDLADTQVFIPVSSAKNAAEYAKLSVGYSGGVGTVSIKDTTVKPGTYKFKSEPIESSTGEIYNAVTLTVKVVNTVPAMTIKGSAALNLAARTGTAYTETAQLQLNAKLPEGYAIDTEKTKGSIVCTTKGMGSVAEKFGWDIQDDKLLVFLGSPVTAKQYSFTMTPVYINRNSGNSVTGKAVKFNVKVYKGTIAVKLSAKGTLNLLDRGNEYTLKNSIVYTPKFSNLKDQVEAVRIFDADIPPQLSDSDSRYFKAEVIDGQIYVTPRKGASVENKKNYPVRMWVKLASYGGNAGGGMWVPGTFKIKTAQILPKVTTDRNSLNLYLSNKSYAAVFTVKPQEGSIGIPTEVAFGEKDKKSKESFDIVCKRQSDNSLKVYLKLKDTVSFAGNSTSNLTMYVMYEGQGVKTNGTAIKMSVKINK